MAEHEEVKSVPKTGIDMEQLKIDVQIFPESLTKHMQEHTGLYLFYAEKSVKARKALDRVKLALETIEYQLDKEHRAILKEESAKTTEGQIRAAVVTDSRYLAASVRVISAHEEFRLTETAAEAFNGRRELLLQMARDAAREGQGHARMTTVAPPIAEAKERALAAIAHRLPKD